jgi:PAS domain S-box-containing protein
MAKKLYKDKKTKKTNKPFMLLYQSKALRKSTGKDYGIVYLYNRMIELTGYGIYRYSFDKGRILFANKGFVKIIDLNYAPEKIVGKLLKDLIVYTEKPGKVRRAISKRGVVHSFKYHFKTLKGDDRWVLHDSYLIKDPITGEKVVEAIVKDITDLVQLEKQRDLLIKTLENKNKVLEKARNEIEKKADKLQSMYEAIEISNEELQTTSEELESTNEELQVVNEELERTSKELENTNIELENFSKDLEKKVNERTAELRKNVAIIDQLYESTASALILIDLNYNILHANQEASRMSNISKDNMRHMKCFQLMHNPHCHTDMCFMKKILSGQEQITNEVTKTMPNGREIPCLVFAKSFKDEKGKIVGMIEDIRDITEIKSLEKKLIQSEKLTVLGKLAGSVSHELRNPLGIMKNAIYYLTMAKDKLDEKTEKEYFGILRRQITISDKIVGNMLDFARPKDLIVKQTMIDKIIDQAVSEIEISENIKIKKDVMQDIEMSVDPFQIQQALYNIILNSVQAIKKQGLIEIRVEDKGDCIKIIISDNGEGIRHSDMKNIFEPLFSTKARGEGLGLAIVKNIIDKHKGRIEVESEYGKGTTFVVCLPKEQ